MKNIFIFAFSFILVGCGINSTNKRYVSRPFLSTSPVIISESSCLNGRILYCFDQACNIKNKPELYGKDYWQTPEETKMLDTGDCEDKSIYLKFLLDNNQIQSKLCIGFYNLIISSTLHAWIEVTMIHDTYILDPSFGVIASRSQLAETSYAPIYGNFYIYNKINEFKRRTNYQNTFNDKYERFDWFMFKNKWAFKLEEIRKNK